MKRELLLSLAAMSALAFASCDKDDNGGGDPPKEMWGIEMTAQYTKVMTGETEFRVALIGRGGKLSASIGAMALLSRIAP